ncbi:MAG: hypothetical protein ACE5GX_19415 [Thermoanaerobaculia bacterium]
MSLRALRSGIALLTFALPPNFTGNAWAGDFVSQGNFGDSLVTASTPHPVKEFPTFESIVHVPRIFDPLQQDFLAIFCDVKVTKQGEGVKKVKGTYMSELFVFDNDSETVEISPLGSGKFKTDGNGFDNFALDVPVPLFIDGFESGDTSAWTYTRVEFTNKKKSAFASVSCVKAAGSSL